MTKDFIEYNFTGSTNDYVQSYDSTKLNIGYLMTRTQDSDGDTYVTPVESRFLRGFEIGNATVFQINSVGFLKYNDDVSWIFYSNGNALGTTINRMTLATYSKSSNSITQIGSINITSTAVHSATSINPSLEKHTSGTVDVNGSSVNGIGTTWVSDGVCVGNRIGFGSTDPAQITQWYSISSVISETSLIIRTEYASDGTTTNLSIPAGTSYVIEDLRLIYIVRNGSTNTSLHGVAIVKGLRFENFSEGTSTIPVSTTVDNLRAFYRITDSAGIAAVYVPSGLILEDKVSLTEQYLYVQSSPATTTVNIQKFNIRAALTVTTGRSDSAYIFTTGTVNHLGTNVSLFNPFVKGSNGDYYINFFTRIVRIIPANITSGSTNFIGDYMPEVPLGNSGTYPLSAQLQGFHYLPIADKFYISHTQGTIRNYVTSYLPASGQFERVTNINDFIQSGTYVVDELDTLTANFNSSTLRTFYHDGLTYIARDINSNMNVLYTLPIEADREYHTTTKACIITPEFTLPSAVTYDKVYLNKKAVYNNNRFVYPSETVNIYVRTTGISDDSGAWTLISANGDISYLTGASVQFKIAFSTIGLSCIPDKIYGLVISYFSNDIPESITSYEPSFKNSNVLTQTFSWRQVSEFINNIPTLNIDVYNAFDSTLLLTDNSATPANGVWEYSNNEGSSWNAFTPSANAIGNYVRYTPSSSLGTGIKVKPILYKAASPIYISPSAPPVFSQIDLDAQLFLAINNITDPIIISAVNQLVIDLKLGLVWQKMIIIYPFVGGTASTHRINLKSPADYALTFFGGWVHDSGGIKMNNIDTFATTGYSGNNGNLSISAYLTQRVSGGQGTIMGAYNSGIFGMRATATEDIFHNNAGTTGKTITPTTVHPFLGNSRIGATSWFAQNDNNVFTNYTDAIPSASIEIRIGIVSNLAWYGAHQLGFVHIGEPLTQSEMSVVRTAVINFETALGRNA